MSNAFNISDTFDQLTGKPDVSYVASDMATSVAQQKHYDIRSYFNDAVTVPWTMNDMHFWDVNHFSSFTMDTFTHRRSVSGGTFRRHLMSEIDVYTQSQMDTMTMDQLDFAAVNAGNEEWPNSDPDVTFGKDSAQQYANSLRVNVTTTLKTVTSKFVDDILTNFNDDTYFIEIALPGFPAQAAAGHLDLSNSFIDFTSDATYTAGVTDSVAFSESLNSLTAGGNTYFRIPRTRLTNVSLNNITGIRLRLKGVGTPFTLTLMAMRLIPNSYVYKQIDTNTKKGLLTRYISQTGLAGGVFSAPTPMFFPNTRPKNGQFYIRFNSGHNPVGNDNVFRFYMRHQTSGDHVRVELWARSTQSRLRIYDTFGGVETEIFSTPINSNILTAETNYWLIINLSETTINASIYNFDGVFLTTQLYSTGDQTLTHKSRGYVGYSLEPYNYDFVIDNVGTQLAEYATYESTPFNSYTPVTGATLLPQASNPNDLLLGKGLLSFGDGVVTYNSSTSEYTVTRTGVTWVGGVISSNTVGVGTTDQIYIEGDIFLPTISRGHYRVALMDTNYSVAWIYDLPNLSVGQWNHFKIPISMSNIPPQGFYVHVNQAGYYPDVFKVKNLKLDYATVNWYASPDAGTTWQPFLDANGDYYTGVKFDTPSTALKVRAIARSDDAWIASYEVIPRYKYPGHR